MNQNTKTTHDGLSPQRDSKCLLRADGRVTAAQVAAQKMNVITALPYTITTPGTYVLLGNLVAPFTEGDVTMITINAPTGKVVFNVKDFTIERVWILVQPRKYAWPRDRKLECDHRKRDDLEL